MAGLPASTCKENHTRSEMCGSLLGRSTNYRKKDPLPEIIKWKDDGSAAGSWSTTGSRRTTSSWTMRMDVWDIIRSVQRAAPEERWTPGVLEDLQLTLQFMFRPREP